MEVDKRSMRICWNFWYVLRRGLSRISPHLPIAEADGRSADQTSFGSFPDIPLYSRLQCRCSVDFSTTRHHRPVDRPHDTMVVLVLHRLILHHTIPVGLEYDRTHPLELSEPPASYTSRSRYRHLLLALLLLPEDLLSAGCTDPMNLPVLEFVASTTCSCVEQRPVLSRIPSRHRVFPCVLSSNRVGPDFGVAALFVSGGLGRCRVGLHWRTNRGIHRDNELLP